MGLTGRIVNQVRFVQDDLGRIIGYRNAADQDEALLTPAQVAATQALVSVDGNVTAAALPSLVGTPGQLVRLSDGDDAGALLVWAIPEKSASYAWCWQIWPKASYF